jgi:hypothetical protein
MGKRRRRYVARAAEGIGWRIWDHTANRWWGKPFPHCPEELLNELNGAKRPDRIVAFSRSSRMGESR